MAITYAEFLTAFENVGLRNKVRVAICIAARNVISENSGVTNHVNRMKWARLALAQPEQYVDAALNAAIAENQASAPNLAAITGATDGGVQTQINNIINCLAGEV